MARHQTTYNKHADRQRADVTPVGVTAGVDRDTTALNVVNITSNVNINFRLKPGVVKTYSPFGGVPSTRGTASAIHPSRYIPNAADFAMVFNVN